MATPLDVNALRGAPSDGVGYRRTAGRMEGGCGN